MYLLYVFCSLLDIPSWLQNHLLTCPFKKVTGIDCPGCGFQRSVLALIEGDFKNSLYLYPATIPLLATAIYMAIDARYHFDKANLVKKTLYLVTGSIIVLSYTLKMTGHTPAWL
jgi:hypothetical protein